MSIEMKHACTLLIGLLGCLAIHAQPPGYVLDLNARSVQVDSADGRKMMIVLLPAQADTAVIGQLLRFQQRHGGQIRIIAIVAPDAVPQLAAAVQNGYGKLLPAGIILTKGMAATDSVTGPRASLLKYLSGRSRKRQTDRLVIGCKYFLSETGRPFAQLGPNGSLDSRVADYIVQTRVPGESRQ